ncbi:MAG: glycosyltransferase [Reyranella sp.]|uniref:glycosyltransferase n=1 Tax=Reyranella sp. TaxID=1929291 RepID=UPI003D104255
MLAWIGLGWWAFTMVVQWLSAALARRRRPAAPAHHAAADFSIVAPLAGRHDAAPAYIGALEELSRQGAEVLICVAGEGDEAIGQARALWPAAPILVGSDDTFNPKMNNVRKGLEAASRPVVVLCDAGVAVTLDDLRRAATELSDKVGLVLGLKAGWLPANFAAELECAYINGHQARFLLAADRLGMPVASGGMTVLARDVLEEIGGHQAFLNYIADDYSIVRTMRDRGRRTTWLANTMPHLPVGDRRWSDVWRRQVRWASTRLNLTWEVRVLALLDPAIGWFISGVAGATGLAALGWGPAPVALALLAHSVAWFAAEAWFLAAYGLPFGPRAWAASLVREALVPVLLAKAWRGRRRIDWRGTDLAAGWRPEGDDASGRYV